MQSLRESISWTVNVEAWATGWSHEQKSRIQPNSIICSNRKSVSCCCCFPQHCFLQSVKFRRCFLVANRSLTHRLLTHQLHLHQLPLLELLIHPSTISPSTADPSTISAAGQGAHAEELIFEEELKHRSIEELKEEEEMFSELMLSSVRIIINMISYCTYCSILFGTCSAHICVVLVWNEQQRWW